MSFADDTESDTFTGRDHMLPAITPEAVAKALEGFALAILPGKDIDWLAMAVRRSLAFTIPNVGDGPDRTSNADIKAELERLAGLAGSTWETLFTCDHAADSHLREFSRQHWARDRGTHIGNGLAMGEPSDYRRFKAVVAEIDWLSGFLRQAARAVESQRGPWTESEKKRLRIERGYYLAPIYEASFGKRVSANNWPSGMHKKPSAFMDFYQRMVTLAINERATPNIAGVLKTACRLHKQHPVQYPDGVIPGLE